MDWYQPPVRRSSYSHSSTSRPMLIRYDQVTLYTRAVNRATMSWPWMWTWGWFEEERDQLFSNGQSEERFLEGALHFVGGHRYNVNQMSRLWQGGKHPRIMQNQGILFFKLMYAVLKGPISFKVHEKHFLAISLYPVSELPTSETCPSLTSFACSAFQKECAKKK